MLPCIWPCSPPGGRNNEIGRESERKKKISIIFFSLFLIEYLKETLHMPGIEVSNRILDEEKVEKRNASSLFLILLLS